MSLSVEADWVAAMVTPQPGKISGGSVERSPEVASIWRKESKFEQLVSKLNQYLPPDLKVLAVEEAAGNATLRTSQSRHNSRSQFAKQPIFFSIASNHVHHTTPPPSRSQFGQARTDLILARRSCILVSRQLSDLDRVNQICCVLLFSTIF